MSPPNVNGFNTPLETAIFSVTSRTNATATITPVNPAHIQPTPMEKFERWFEELSWKIRRSIDRSLEAHKRKRIMKKSSGRVSVVELDEKTEYWIEEFEIIGADELEEKRKRSEEEAAHLESQWISKTSTTITGGHKTRPQTIRRKSTGGLLQFLSSTKSSLSPSQSSSQTIKPKPKRRGTWKF